MTTHYRLLNGSAAILGRGINHRKLDPEERVVLAADAVTGARPFVPSCKQACLLFGVSPSVLTRYLKDLHQFGCELDEFGTQHLDEMAAENGKAGNGNGHGNSAAAVAMLRDLTPAERLEVSRSLGLGWLWDEMIVPGIHEDQQSAPAE